MMGSRRCELCKTGKVRPMQLSPSQAIMMCDNHDCDYLFNTSPWDNVIIRNMTHTLETPIDAESWIRASNSCSSSSGVHSDIKSPLFSPASSLVSLTDKEVEFLLRKSYAPPRVGNTSQNNTGPSSWKKLATRGSREHGRSSTKLGKRSGQVASALSITTAFDLSSEGMPAERHSDALAADAELEVVAKNEFFDMLNELDLDTPPVSKNRCSSGSDLGDLPPLDSWMREEYKGSQNDGALGNAKSFQGPHEGKKNEGSGLHKGDADKFSEAGVPFIPSAGSAFSQVPPSKVMTPNYLAPVKEEMISNSLLPERGCDIESREEVEMGGGDLLYAGALLADTQTSSPASSHGSEDSGYNEECRVMVRVQKPLKTQEQFGVHTQVITTKDSRGHSFASMKEVCATNIKKSSHPEEVIKYLIKPVSVSNMINIQEYNILPAVVSPNNAKKSIDSSEESTNVLEVPSKSGVEKCSKQESLFDSSVEPSSSGQNISQLIEDTVTNVALHNPHNTHSLLKRKSLDTKSSGASDSETSATLTQNGVVPLEHNHAKSSISSEKRKECLETKIDHSNLLEEPSTSLYNISDVEIGGNKREGSSNFVTETTLFCDTRQSSEVLQPPSVSECAKKKDWSNVLEEVIMEEKHGFLGSMAVETGSDSNTDAGVVQEGFRMPSQSEKDEQSSSCNQSQLVKCPSVSENISRLSSGGEICINSSECGSPQEDEMNRQDSLSPSSDMGFNDKAQCSLNETQTIRRGPGRPRGRGRPRIKNKSVPSTNSATSRSAPTIAKVEAPSPAGYVRESRSRKRRNLETRAYYMPREEEWDEEDQSEQDIRKGISELLPSSYVQLARGRKTSKWSGGAKTSSYNCSSVNDEADVKELYVEVIVEGCRTLPLYLQQHLRDKQKRENRASEGSQEQKVLGKSDWFLKPKKRHDHSRKYFEAVLANVDFDEQFFQCPTKEHDKDGNSLDELSDGVLLFGQTGEEHSPVYKEDQRLLCDTAKDSTHIEGVCSDHVGIGIENPYFLSDLRCGLEKRDVKTEPIASQEFGEAGETCTEKAAESLLMLAARGRSSGMCGEQIFSDATQDVQVSLRNKDSLYGSNQSSSSSIYGNTKTQLDLLLSHESRANIGQECTKQSGNNTTTKAVDRNVLESDDAVQCVSQLNQQHGMVSQPYSMSDQYPNRVQCDLNLFVNDTCHDMNQENQVTQNKEERLKINMQINQLPCDIQKNEMHTGQVNLFSRNNQVNTVTRVSSLGPSTKENERLGRNDHEDAIQTLAGCIKMEPNFFGGEEDLNKIGEMNHQQKTSKVKEENCAPGSYISSSDFPIRNVQMCHMSPHTPEQQSLTSPFSESSPSHYNDSDNEIPTFTIDDMDEIHVLLPKKRKKNERMGEGHEYKKLKKEVVEDVADCSMASIDFDEVPLSCGILDSTFVHEECCALRGSVTDTLIDKDTSNSGQKLFGICYARKSSATRRISDGYSKRCETFLNSEMNIKPAAVASPAVIDAFVKGDEQAEKRILEEEAAYGDIRHSPQFHGIWSPGSESSQPGLLDLDISLSTIEPFTDLFSWSPESGEITYNADEQEMIVMPESQDASVKSSIRKTEENGTAIVMESRQDPSSKDSIHKAEESSKMSSAQLASAKDGKLEGKGSVSINPIKPGIGPQPQPNEVAVKGVIQVLTEGTEPLLKPVSPHATHEGMLSSVDRATPNSHHVTPSTSSNFFPSSQAGMFPAPTLNSQATHLYTHDSGPAPHVAQQSGTSLTFTDHMLCPRVPQVSTTELMGIDCKDVFQLEPTTLVPPALISSYCSPKPSRVSLSVRRGQSQWAAVKPIIMLQKPSANCNRVRHIQSTRNSGSALQLLALERKGTQSSKETSDNFGESASENSSKISVLKNIGEVSSSMSVEEPVSKNSVGSSLLKMTGEPFAPSTSKLGLQRTDRSEAKEFIEYPHLKSHVDSTNIPKVNANLPNITKNLPKTNLTSKADPMHAVVIGNTFLIKAPSVSKSLTVKPGMQGSSQISKSVAAPVIVTQNAIPSCETLEETSRRSLTALGKRVGDNCSAELARHASAPGISDVSKAHFPCQNKSGTSQMLTPALNPGAISASSVGNHPVKSSPASCNSLLGSSTLINPSDTKISDMASIHRKISSKVANKIGELCQSTSDDAPKVVLVSVGDKTFLYRREDK